jgi:hypothetical protein
MKFDWVNLNLPEQAYREWFSSVKKMHKQEYQGKMLRFTRTLKYEK